MAKGKKRKRGKCKCHDIKSCTAYVAKAYRARRSGKARAAARKEEKLAALYNG